MEQSLYREANSRSASREILRPLWNSKFYCRVYKNPPVVPILSQINPAHNFQSYFSSSPIDA